MPSPNRPAAQAGSFGSNERKIMNRSDLTRLLVARLKNDEAVVGGIGNTNFDLWAAGPRPQNFYMFGSMGLACPIALGVALAQPKRKVIALEGDGSLLMQLGVLTTIAALRPANLTIIVWDNGIYQITGAQPTATAAGADLVAIARGAGIAQSDWALDEASFERLLERSLVQDGPWLIAAKIDDRPAAGTTERDPAQLRDRFMRGLGVK
jgi:thiamine pyrophosphate-dependent acetolactate synthase large subunit-like protein